jgi:hypothetical protein
MPALPRCFPLSANLLTLCKTQPPESPSCIALIAQVPPPQTIVFNDTLPATKIINKSQDMTRKMDGLHGTIALNTDANNVITSVTFTLTNVTDFQYQPAVLRMTPSSKRLVPVSK